jgi:excisionase family DNA binding protein
MGTLEPIALSPRDAAQFLSISKRSLSRLIRAHKIEARKDGPRTLVDVASLKAYYEALPLKTDLVFDHPITGRRHRPRNGSH